MACLLMSVLLLLKPGDEVGQTHGHGCDVRSGVDLWRYGEHRRLLGESVGASGRLMPLPPTKKSVLPARGARGSSDLLMGPAFRCHYTR